ncbi:hypothetical protein CGSMWGv0288E_00714 [Gardnerella vaginalis 0288E]|nr:hypothetical protein [Gardnerella vaginalis]EIK77930.1 hypothetical protein CGSMWGv0288E_00714 [Gardnerella vaginalis 0288E]
MSDCIVAWHFVWCWFDVGVALRGVGVLRVWVVWNVDFSMVL